jgi:hypothetical protein
LNRKILAAPLGILVLAAGAAGASAQGTIVGNSGETNGQTAGTTQTIGQSNGSGGVVVGSPTQTAQNQSETNLNNDQAIGGGTGSVIVGNSGQTNGQSATTNQGITQGPASGVTVGSPTQTAQNQSSTVLNSTQLIGTGDGVIVGGTGQTNTQAASTPQAIGQGVGGGVVVGDPTQGAQNQSTAVANNCQNVSSGGGGCGIEELAFLLIF